jgi:hypothetical protein
MCSKWLGVILVKLDAIMQLMREYTYQKLSCANCYLAALVLCWVISVYTGETLQRNISLDAASYMVVAWWERLIVVGSSLSLGLFSCYISTRMGSLSWENLYRCILVGEISCYSRLSRNYIFRRFLLHNIDETKMVDANTLAVAWCAVSLWSTLSCIG